MLTPVDTIAILQNHPDRSFRAGEVIFEDGSQGDVMYGVLEGEVDLFVQGKLLETMGPGKVFGAGSLLHEDRSRESTAIAKSDCKLAYLDKPHFLFAVQQAPMFALEVLAGYSDRFRRLKRMFVA